MEPKKQDSGIDQDEISTNEKPDTPLKKNLSIAEAKLIDYVEDETDSGHGSNVDTKESVPNDPSTADEDQKDHLEVHINERAVDSVTINFTGSDSEETT